jgi:hypothetical protein
MSVISIEDISDRSKLLFVMWQYAELAGFYRSGKSPRFKRVSSEEVYNMGYIDIYCGKLIKTRLDNTTVDTWGYNRQNSEKPLETIVSELRAMHPGD